MTDSQTKEAAQALCKVKLTINGMRMNPEHAHQILIAISNGDIPNIGSVIKPR